MQSNDGGDDGWAANIEEQYYEAIERQQPNYEAQYLSERDTCIRNLFHNFQESATSIAQLYKGKCDSYFLLLRFFCNVLKVFFLGGGGRDEGIFIASYSLCCTVYIFAIDR